ncbi:MAG: phosphoribosylglycinamide formyltransferase [Chlorobi bacterium]|nr:phosphoribosylglycinamide formyltransferase [Chlorobiota bacterium]
MSNVILFASGSGTNVENIVNFFNNDTDVTIKCILTNNPDAFVIERAKRLNIPFKVFNREDLYKNGTVLKILKDNQPDLIVLSGFLWLMPSEIIKEFPDKIINIHPALLPKYGGKGMYGSKVHKAIVNNRENETGITIHYVNEKYDEGNIIFQARCEVLPSDTPDDVAEKVHKLEYRYFPEIIKQLLQKQNNK